MRATPGLLLTVWRSRLLQLLPDARGSRPTLRRAFDVPLPLLHDREIVEIVEIGGDYRVIRPVGGGIGLDRPAERGCRRS
jgi:hypothetical protein